MTDPVSSPATSSGAETAEAAAWWAGVAAVATDVECSGGTHRLVWREGELVPEAHDDPEGEALLAVLGGDPPTCIVLAEQWRIHSQNLRVLAYGRRQAGEQVGLTRAEWAEIDAKAKTRATPSRSVRVSDQAERQGFHQLDRLRAERLELLSLFALPSEFQDRLMLSVAAAWADRWAAGDERVGPVEMGRLVAALVGRAGPVLEAWSGRPAEVVLARPGAAPSVAGGDRVEAHLGFDWLARVWCRDLALVGGRFVLAALDVTDTEATVLAMAEPGTPPEAIRLQVRLTPDGREWAPA